MTATETKKIFGQRLKELLQKRNLNQSQIAKKMGISPQSVQFWVKGETMPTGERMRRLAELLEVDAQEFFRKEGEVISSIPPSVPFEYRDKRYVYIEDLKVDDKPSGVKMVATERDFFDSVIGEGEAAEFRIIAVRDNSMSPTIKAGDSIIININDDKFESNGLYCFSLSDGLYIKRLQRVPTGILAISDNPAYRDFLIAKDEPQPKILGKIIAVMGFSKID